MKTDLDSSDPHAKPSAFDDAFERWSTAFVASGAGQQNSSLRAYGSLWRHFTKWCLGQPQPISLRGLDAADLERYVLSLEGVRGPDGMATDRHIWRVLSTIDRVLAAYTQAHGLPPSDAAHAVLHSRPDWRHAQAAQRDPLPDYLPPRQARLLVNYLTSIRDGGANAAAAKSWQSLRNHCAVALHLGAGLTPADVRALQVDSVMSDGGRAAGMPWKVRVPAHGQSPERETPLARWAAQLLGDWLETRQAAGLGGTALLPSTQSGKPWGKVAHYLAVTGVLQASGIDAALVSGGPFRLRHTFALRQLRRGHPEADVARWLGLADTSSLSRYRHVSYAPVDDLA